MATQSPKPARFCFRCPRPLRHGQVRYCSNTCRRIDEASLRDRLQPFVQEFGALPGSGAYRRLTQGRPEFPTLGLLVRRYGSLQATAQALELPYTPQQRRWTPVEDDFLEEQVGVLPSFAVISQHIGRSPLAVQKRAQHLEISHADYQGRIDVATLCTWVHYSPITIKRALAARLFPGSRVAMGRWQVWPAAVLAVEGILFRDRADLDPEVRWTIEQDLANNTDHHLAPNVIERISLWQAYREPGKLYPWRHGEIRRWWIASLRRKRGAPLRKEDK